MMKRITDWLRRKPQALPAAPDKITEQVAKAVDAHGVASSRAMATLRDLLQENDRLHNRPQR